MRLSRRALFALPLAAVVAKAAPAQSAEIVRVVDVAPVDGMGGSIVPADIWKEIWARIFAESDRLLLEGDGSGRPMGLLAELAPSQTDPPRH
jgi:hypothetical protein